jgi:hypothetical protein
MSARRRLPVEYVAALDACPINASDRHFGVCPICHKNDGFINIGPAHLFKCDKHKVRWQVGYNLFGCWRSQTKEEQEQIFNALNFGFYKDIEPFCLDAIERSEDPESAS